MLPTASDQVDENTVLRAHAPPEVKTQCPKGSWWAQWKTTDESCEISQCTQQTAQRRAARGLAAKGKMAPNWWSNTLRSQKTRVDSRNVQSCGSSLVIKNKRL